MNIPIDWATVSWGYVALMSGFAFLSGLIGSVLSFRSRLVGAILTALLFAVIYVAWTYYLVPQGLIPANFVPAVVKAA
jgi:hypothetical protein